LGGGEKTGKNPTDRSKLGTKHHILTEAHGIPLAVTATGSNVPDVKEVLNVVDTVPPVGGKIGHPPQRPDELYADRAYDSDPHREKVKKRRIVPHFARRNTEHGSGLGIYRWVVERTASWLHSFRRLRLRTDRNGQVHEAFLALGSALICMWFL
jgi:transposase